MTDSTTSASVACPRSIGGRLLDSRRASAAPARHRGGSDARVAATRSCKAQEGKITPPNPLFAHLCAFVTQTFRRGRLWRYHAGAGGQDVAQWGCVAGEDSVTAFGAV